MGLRIQGLAPGNVTWGRDAQAVESRPFKGPASKLALYQPAAEYYRVVEEDPEPQKKVTFATLVAGGRRFAGLAGHHFRRPDLLIGIKNFWQEYPRKYPLTARERSTLSSPAPGALTILICAPQIS